MRSVAAGPLEVRLRAVRPDDRTTPLRQRRRYNTRATADVQHPVASFDPGEIEKWTRQAAAPSRHEGLKARASFARNKGVERVIAGLAWPVPFQVRKGPV